MARIPGLLAFVAIFVACLADAFSVSWWLACAAAGLLVLVSLTEHRPTYSRYASTGRLGAQSMLLLGSTLNAATVAGAGYAVGRALAWVWIG